MKFLILALLALSVSSTTHRYFTLEESVQLWGEYKQTYNKEYTPAEELYRFTVFQNNLEIISELQFEDPSASYGATKFADLSPSEFEALYLGYQPGVSHATSTYQFIGDSPDSYDWTDQKAVSDVKDQGQCGSCWSFSTTGNIESQNFISTKTMIPLSEQQLVDCDTTDSGCEGGLMDNAFKWLIANGGLESEDDYPYTAEDGDCKFDASKVQVTISSYQDISQDEDVIKDSTYNLGPLAIGINANFLQFYTGGVADPVVCSKTQLNHGVLIVGYGNDKKDFWKIKNSWGAAWGEQGYFRIVRGKGKCGLNTAVSCASI